MRPPDPHQQSSNRPNLMSGTRKRSGGGNILDQLEPKAARGKAAGSFSNGIEPRWVWAGAGLVVLLVAGLAAIAWSNASKARTLPPAPIRNETLVLGPEKPVFEAAPARIDRVASVQTHKAAAVLLAQLEPPPMPPPMPLVVLPRETARPAVAPVAKKQAAAGPPSRTRAATKPGAVRHASRKPIVKRDKAVAAPEPAKETDSDVALISAIRKASGKQSD